MMNMSYLPPIFGLWKRMEEEDHAGRMGVTVPIVISLQGAFATPKLNVPTSNLLYCIDTGIP